MNLVITSWRNLRKHKLVSSINILGLTLGLASSLLAILFAIHELSYESCHKRADPTLMFHLSGAGIAILILATTVFWQSWQAATSNPVESIKYE